jgi:heme/copper-type cytochrome/quinol oxidase subunit 3
MSLEHHEPLANVASEVLVLGGVMLGWAHVITDMIPIFLTTITTLLGICWYSVNLYEYWKEHRVPEQHTLEEDPPDDDGC